MFEGQFQLTVRKANNMKNANKCAQKNELRRISLSAEKDLLS